MAETIKGFPWRRGMSSNGAVLTDEDIVAIKQSDSYGMSPDRNDPATLGAFLGAVREAFAEPLMYLIPGHSSWLICRRVDESDGDGDEVLLTDGSWFPIDEEGNEHPPIRGATEWDAIEAAWNVRPGRVG